MSQRPNQERGLGGTYLSDGGCHFRVWAPAVKTMAVQLLSPGRERIVLKKDDLGNHDGAIASVRPGSRYFYRLDGAKERPDPASRFQSQGVHGASEIVDPAFPWEDDGWCGLALRDFVIYELHVGIAINRIGRLPVTVQLSRHSRDRGGRARFTTANEGECQQRRT